LIYIGGTTLALVPRPVSCSKGKGWAKGSSRTAIASVGTGPDDTKSQADENTGDRFGRTTRRNAPKTPLHAGFFFASVPASRFTKIPVNGGASRFMFSGMSDRDPPSRPPKAPAPTDAPAAPASRSSGRVQFDERGQAIWEWAVKTGMFDRNASTQRIRALVETPIELQLEDSPLPGTGTGAHGATASARETGPIAARPATAPPGTRATGPIPARATTPSSQSGAGTAPGRSQPPARTAAPTTPARPGVVPQPGENGGFDPYSRGPAKRPETNSYNPYESGPRKK
jgi:hypothetical protein